MAQSQHRGRRLHGEMESAPGRGFEAVYALVRRIPTGRVMTYGQVAVGQLGGTIDLSWNGVTGIDVVTVWDWLQTPEGGTYSLTPVDPVVAGPWANPDGIPGIGIIDGPWITLSPAFELYEVPEPVSVSLVATALVALVGLRRRFR